MSQAPAVVVVLAAGEGTRMRSATPKVLHPMLGRSMLGHVLAAVEPLRAERLAVVVGHGRHAVAEHVGAVAPDADVVVQDRQDGTGHAVRVALKQLDVVGGGIAVVVCGDAPLLTTATLQRLVDEHLQSTAAATVLTARLADPAGYGRVIRDASGEVTAIVEDPDADDRQRLVDEVNSGMYAFDVARLREALGALTRDNSQGEEYLTDAVEVLHGAGHRVSAVTVADPREVMGVNDQAQLAAVRAALRDRVLHGLMAGGVTVVDPATTWVDVQATVEADAVLLPATELRGRTQVGARAQVGPGTVLTDTVVGADAVVTFTHAEGAVVGEGARVGPYTFLRPGTVLGPRTRAGAYVEMKNVEVGADAKVPHLTYAGDAEIGEGANIGAATIFVNYDGVAKHRTVVGAHARVGSDTMLVAPVRIGAGAYTAAGSVITDDVPAGAMAVARGRQRTIAGWVERRRAGSPSARAAAAARDQADLSSGKAVVRVQTDEQDDTAEGGPSA